MPPYAAPVTWSRPARARPTSLLEPAGPGPPLADLGKHHRSLLGRPVVLYGTVGVFALLVLLKLGVMSALNRPFVSGTDSSQYASIAASVAHGGGYRDPVGLFPNNPATDRVPVWPLLLSVGMRIAPNARDELVSRLTNLLFLALAGVAMTALCRRLGARPLLCLLAGLYVALSPILLYVALGGLSEISFILLVTAGVALAFAGGRCVYLGAILIGLGPLVRPNFVIVPPLFVALAIGYAFFRREPLPRATLIRMALALALSLAPTGVWLARNYALTGRFPLLTTFYGEAFYGSNNDGTATALEYWGGWVFPDYIPGETPKKDLAMRLKSDVALNDYYLAQGKAWMRSHWTAVPRLMLGKMVRSLALLPWSPSSPWQEWFAFSSRLPLFVLLLATIRLWWRAMDRNYMFFLAALGISHIMTTLLIDGQLRYSFCFFELFTIPCAALGLDRWLKNRGAPATTA